MNSEPPKYDLKFTVLAIAILIVVIAVLYGTRKPAREDQKMIDQSNGKETRELFQKLEKSRSWNDSNTPNR
jgi:hypothetical protein